MASTSPATPADVDRFTASLRRIASESPTGADEQIASTLFDWRREIIISRAPGRLDVMGGIADYSGSLVLQMPIAEATMVAVQLQPDRDDVRIVSFGGATTGRAPLFGVTLAELRNGLSDATDPFEALRRRIEADSGTHWAAYVVGALAVLLHEGIGSFSVGLSLLVYSEVPEGKGVSSSAAIEVATMIALLATEGIELSPADRLPILCQRVEHKVVGAPCGVMDQMASALGLEGRLLSLLCRPAKLLEPVGIPTHLRFWGIDSGVRHFVGGSDYGTVRCATFMGRAMLRRALEGKQPLEFLTELTPDRLAELEHNLPEEISGAEFLRQHADHGDSATTIDPSIVYKVRLCTRHPVLEHHRVSEFERLLRQPASKEQLARLGAPPLAPIAAVATALSRMRNSPVP